MALISKPVSSSQSERNFNKDFCTKHGIFKQTNKFYIGDRRVFDIKIVMDDYFYAMEEFERALPEYIRRLKGYTTLGGETNKYNNDILESMDHKTIFKTKGQAHNGSLICFAKGGDLIGLDSYYEKGVLDKTLMELGLTSIPVHLHPINKLELISANGKTAGKLGWTETELAGPVYFELGLGSSLTVGKVDKVGETLSSKNSTILCTKTRNPFDITNKLDRIRARYLSNDLKDYILSLETILGNFKTEIQTIGNLTEIEGTGREVKFKVPFELIRIIELTKRYFKDDLFWEFNRIDFDEYRRIMEFAKEYKDRRILFGRSKIGLDQLELHSEYFNVTELIEVGNLTIIGKVGGADDRLVAKLELVYTQPGVEVKIFDFHPYAREPIVPIGGKLILTPNTEVFKKEFEVNLEECSDSNNEKYCKNFNMPRFEEKEGNCGKYLMGRISWNDCDTFEPVGPTIIRSDCHGEDNFVSSFYEPYSLEVTCNEKSEQTTELSAGIHEVKTECKVKSGETVLVPQLKSGVSRDFTTRMVEIFRTRGDLNHTLLLVCVTITCLCILLLGLNVGLMICICCPRQARNLQCHGCCMLRINRSRRNSRGIELGLATKVQAPVVPVLKEGKAPQTPSVGAGHPDTHGRVYREITGKKSSIRRESLGKALETWDGSIGSGIKSVSDHELAMLERFRPN